MGRFIDIHHHLLYGMDDGPQTQRETIQMLHAACADGTSTLIATPHAFPGEVAFDFPALLEKVEWANAYCQERGLDLTVYPGAEIFYTDATLRLLDARHIPTLAWTKYVLIEFSPDCSYDSVFRAVRGMLKEGYAPILAHVERYRNLMRKPQCFEELKGIPNVRLQVNANTIIRSAKFLQEMGVRSLLEKGLVDYVASDAHSTGERRTRIMECYKVLKERYGAEYANKRVELNQREIFADLL